MSDLHEPGKGQPWNPEDLKFLRDMWNRTMFGDGRPGISGEPLSKEQLDKDVADLLRERGIHFTSTQVSSCTNCRGTFDDLLTPEMLAEMRDSQPPAGEPPIGEQSPKDPA